MFDFDYICRLISYLISIADSRYYYETDGRIPLDQIDTLYTTEQYHAIYFRCINNCIICTYYSHFSE